MARIYRDAWGIPHVRGSSVADVARAQGEVTARDRSWQLEHLRRRATGTCAEVLGAPAVAWDLLARRTLVADTAQRAHDSLAPDTRAFVAAYVDGVNAGLHDDSAELRTLAIAPEPWQPWTPLAVFLAQHLLFASLPGKLWSTRARTLLGDDAVLLWHEGPHTSGSNAWAVGGARAASGLPLVGGDPHRVLESPGVYQQVRLACDDPEDAFDVVGFAFPGVPGVQHFAHAGSVAWAITNASADYQDVYAERLRRVDGRVEALGPDGWAPAGSRVETVDVLEDGPVTVEVVTTERGPLFEGSVDAGEGLSLRAASTVLGDLGFDSLLPLLRARTVDDVDEALDRWVEPVNNVVVATGPERSATASPAASPSGTTPTGSASWRRPRRRPRGQDGSTRCRATTSRPTARWSPPTSAAGPRATRSAPRSPTRTAPGGCTSCSRAATA
jgi:penicillin amidase